MDCRRTIRVTGKGLIKVRPDQTRITVTLEEKYPEYADALYHSSRDTDDLKQILSREGFEKKDLKTLSFDIDAEEFYTHWRTAPSRLRFRSATP